MKIDFMVPFRRTPTAPPFAIEPFREPQGRAPRIARLLALAHKLDAMVRSGEISGYSQLARLGHVSPARLTQIMVLLHLAPVIQEYILFVSTADAQFITDWSCVQSRASRDGIGSANFSSGLFRINLLVAADRGMNVITRRLPQKEKQDDDLEEEEQERNRDDQGACCQT